MITEKRLKEMKRQGMIDYAKTEFGIGFPKYHGADKILAEIMRQEHAREKKKNLK